MCSAVRSNARGQDWTRMCSSVRTPCLPVAPCTERGALYRARVLVVKTGHGGCAALSEPQPLFAVSAVYRACDRYEDWARTCSAVRTSTLVCHWRLVQMFARSQDWARMCGAGTTTPCLLFAPCDARVLVVRTGHGCAALSEPMLVVRTGHRCEVLSEPQPFVCL